MFSGQPLYEPFIYQLYNITMTSLPIMFYALFDFEYEKDFDPKRSKRSPGQKYFMRDPELYRIGIECKCFGMGKFLLWDFYGLFHALMIYICCFHILQTPSQSQMDGKDVGFWVYGHFVYGACVTVANIVILHKFNNYTGWGEVTAIMMILNYFTFYFLENLFPMFP